MRDQLRTSFKESPVEMSAGFLTLAAGIALASLDTWHRALGAVLTAVSSYLISWTMAAAKARAQVRQEVSGSLLQLGTRLATTSSQIVEAIRAAESGQSEAITAFSRVRDAAANLFGIVQKIEESSGEAVSSRAVIENAQKLMALSNRLREIITEGKAVDPEELHEVQSELEAVTQQLGERKVATTTERVSCPRCGNECQVQLGVRKGDSAMPACESCEARFHVHRKSDGGPTFTRIQGAKRYVPLREIAVECPECGHEIGLRVSENEDEPKIRFCLQCMTRLLIDPQEAEVIRSEKAEALQARLVGYDGTRTLLECPECEKVVKGFWRSDSTVFGVCFNCKDATLLSCRDVEGTTTSPEEELPEPPT